MPPNVNSSRMASLLLSTNGQGLSISVSAQILANGKKLARLLPDAACADEIQRRVHLAESACSHMEIKRRSHQAGMA